MKTYDPPIEYDKLNEDLKKCPIHSWRAITGIELIHKEPTLNELNRIYENWLYMPDELKRISDDKSKSLFGITNIEHYYKLVNLY